MARDPNSELVEMISNYARSSPDTWPSSLQLDFENVVKGVSMDSLKWSLGRTIKSSKTPPLPEILGQLYEHSSSQVRAQLLNAILDVAPELRIILALPTIEPKDTERISVSTLIEFAARIEPKIAIDVFSHFYAQHPHALRGLSPPVKGAILNGLARRRRVELARRQLTERPTIRSDDDGETPFSAFARLNAPDEVTAGKPFDFEVGFGSEPDTKSDSRAKFKVEVRAKPGEDMLVIVDAVNATILSEPEFARLPLKLDAKKTFKALPAADAHYVRLSAKYLFRNAQALTLCIWKQQAFIASLRIT